MRLSKLFCNVFNGMQCVWWGHPVTPSTGSVDYFLSLDVELEGGQDDYLEQMVRMDVVNTAHFKQVSRSHRCPRRALNLALRSVLSLAGAILRGSAYRVLTCGLPSLAIGQLRNDAWVATCVFSPAVLPSLNHIHPQHCAEIVNSCWSLDIEDGRQQGMLP